MGIQREGSKKPRVIDEDQILICFCIRYPPSPSLATCPSLIESSKKFSNLPIGITKSYSSKKYPQIKGISKSEKKKKKRWKTFTIHSYHLGRTPKHRLFALPVWLLEFHTAILRAPGGRCLCPCQCGLFGWQIEAAFLFATGRDVGSSIKTLESFPEVKKPKQTWHFMFFSAQ